MAKVRKENEHETKTRKKRKKRKKERKKRKNRKKWLPDDAAAPTASAGPE